MSRVAVVVALAAALVATGCSRNGFDDRTARLDLKGRTTTYQVDSCGLDGTTVFVVGRTDGGSILQAVVGVKPDKAAGVVASTGLTFTDDTIEFAAFGAESWSRRGESGRRPGSVASARVRGSRIMVSGKAEIVGADGRPQGTGPTYPFSLDARCDQLD